MASDGRFLERLAAAIDEVRLPAVVVGNAGAALHGAPVLTADVDILTRDTRICRQKITRIAWALGAHVTRPLEPLSDVTRLVGCDVPVDFMFSIAGGIKFEALRSRSVMLPAGRRTLCVAALRDIIAAKKAANRPKDHASLPILEQTLAVLEGGPPLAVTEPVERPASPPVAEITKPKRRRRGPRR